MQNDVDDFCNGLFIIATYAILIVTFPIWAIPYLIYRLRRKQKCGY